MRIVQLSDLHLFNDKETLLKNVPTWKTLEETWQLAQPYLTDDTTLVITGDLCHDELPPTYVELAEFLGPWASKALVLPGNHDHRDSIRSTFPNSVETFAPYIHFAKSIQGWRLIGLDTQLTGEVKGVLETEQLDWLTTQLRDHEEPTLIFMHHPTFEIGSPWLDPIMLTNSIPFWQTLEEHAHVKGIFCGHIHSDVHRTVNGVPCYATPSTGIQFNLEKEARFSETLAPGFRVIETSGDSLDATVYRLEKVTYIPIDA